jgi:hypothetical protein
MNAAGAAAHRCGWSLNRTDSTANNAHPSANPSRTTPVMTFSSAGMNGAATRTTATISPAATDAATINAILLLAVGGRRLGGWRSLAWVAVIMMAPPEDNYARGRRRLEPEYTKSSVPRHYAAPTTEVHTATGTAKTLDGGTSLHTEAGNL